MPACDRLASLASPATSITPTRQYARILAGGATSTPTAPPRRGWGAAAMSSPGGFYDNVGLPDEDSGTPPAAPARVTSPPPSMPRSPSMGKLLLDLREVNIEDAPAPQLPPLGLLRVAAPQRSADEGAAATASTPRAAPCIALPRQNAELLRHFAIGARWGRSRPPRRGRNSCGGSRAPRCAPDIGGSLIKLVYFSSDAGPASLDAPRGVPHEAGGRLHFIKARHRGPRLVLPCGTHAAPGVALLAAPPALPGPPRALCGAAALGRAAGRSSALTRALRPPLSPRQFETSNVDECIRFIEAKGLHRCSRRSSGKACVKATGGGAFRFNEARPARAASAAPLRA